jgi:hypothetical protein
MLGISQPLLCACVCLGEAATSCQPGVLVSAEKEDIMEYISKGKQTKSCVDVLQCLAQHIFYYVLFFCPL